MSPGSIPPLRGPTRKKRRERGNRAAPAGKTKRKKDVAKPGAERVEKKNGGREDTVLTAPQPCGQYRSATPFRRAD